MQNSKLVQSNGYWSSAREIGGSARIREIEGYEGQSVFTRFTVNETVHTSDTPN